MTDGDGSEGFSASSRLDLESTRGKDGGREPTPPGLGVRMRLRGRASSQGDKNEDAATSPNGEGALDGTASPDGGLTEIPQVDTATPAGADLTIVDGVSPVVPSAPLAEPGPTEVEDELPPRRPAARDLPPVDAGGSSNSDPVQVEADASGPAAASASTTGPEPATGSVGYVPRGLPRIIAVANQKGGVGKTTTAVNLGAGLAELGYRVLVVDLDPQGNATTGLGIDAHTFELSMYDVIMRDAPLEDCVEPTTLKNLFVAPATIDLAGAEIELVPTFSRELKLRRALEAIIDDFDFVLIDCPPSLGLITVNGLAAASEVLVPIQCEYYALEGLGQLLRNVHLVQANLNDSLEVSTIVLTMYDARTKLAEQVAEEVRSHFGSIVCRNIIPRTVRISEAPSFGQPITVFDPSSRGAIAYRELAKEVSGGPA